MEGIGLCCGPFVLAGVAAAWVGACRLLRIPRLFKTIGLCFIAALPVLLILAVAKSIVLDEPLEDATRSGDIRRAQPLLAWGADVEQRFEGGPSLLEMAAERGHLEMVRLLLSHGAEVNNPDPPRNLPEGFPRFAVPALESAAAGGHKEIVRLLLAHGADVNLHSGRDRHTALQAAKKNGHKEIVTLLKQAGVQE